MQIFIWKSRINVVSEIDLGDVLNQLLWWQTCKMVIYTYRAICTNGIIIDIIQKFLYSLGSWADRLQQHVQLKPESQRIISKVLIPTLNEVPMMHAGNNLKS